MDDQCLDRNHGARLQTFKEYPWLEGPVSEGTVIGLDYYRLYAAEAGLRIIQAPDNGLLQDFTAAIPVGEKNNSRLNPRIAHFYEHTAAYKLEVWSQWYAPIAFFARNPDPFHKH